MDFNHNSMKIKLTRDVSRILNISDSSLRRWCRELELQGYHFVISDDEARVFQAKDIDALLYLHHLVKVKRRKLEDGAKEVAERYSQSESQLSPEEVWKQEMADVKEQLKELRQQLNSLEYDNQEMKIKIKRLTQQVIDQEQNEQKYHIEPLLDKRDKELMFVLREMQQAKNHMAAAKHKKWWQFRR